MSVSAAEKKCSFCNAVFTGASSHHKRSCLLYIWEIPHHLDTKQGPMIRVTRRTTDNYLVCKCVPRSGKICDKVFPSKSVLDRHLAEKPRPAYWVVSEHNRTYASPCQPPFQAPKDLQAVLAAQEQLAPLPSDFVAVDSDAMPAAQDQGPSMSSAPLGQERIYSLHIDQESQEQVYLSPADQMAVDPEQPASGSAEQVCCIAHCGIFVLLSCY